MTRLIPREGLTQEVFFAPFKHTLLNPFVTGPLLAAILYDPERVRSLIPAQYAEYLFSQTTLTWLKRLVAFGALRTVNNLLSSLALNNYTTDTFRKGEEIIIVTGGSSGIGEGVVHGLAPHAKAVLCFDLSPPVKALPRNAYFYKCDVTSTANIREVAKEIRAKHGEPTILINNAGIGTAKLILEGDERVTRKTFEVNTISHFFMVKEFVPAMVKANHGHVVTVASLASFVVNAYNADYSCTKASALAFHEGLTSELRSIYNAPNVRTTVVHPCWVRTPLIEPMIATGKFKSFTMLPETVTEAMTAHVLKHRSGQLILPDRYWLVSGIRGWPSWLQEGIRKSVAKMMEVSSELYTTGGQDKAVEEMLAKQNAK